MKMFLKSLIALFFILQLAACGSNITEKNYARITAGMSEEEVIAILGKPTDRSASGIGSFTGSSMVWKGEEITITVNFINGKAQLKNFTR